MTDEAQTATVDNEQLYSDLQDYLRKAKTTADVYAAANAPKFQDGVAQLSDEDREELREFFLVCLNTVRGKVKLDEIKDVPLAVEVVDFPSITDNTPTKADGSKAQSVVVRGKREDNNEPFEFITSSVRIVRHFTRNPLATPENPQKVTIYQESKEAMKNRGAASGTNPMWLIRRHAPASSQGRRNVPF